MLLEKGYLFCVEVVVNEFYGSEMGKFCQLINIYRDILIILSKSL